MPTRVSTQTAYELKISLKHSRPLIWRSVLIPADYTLAQLHDVIQVAMGWENSHLHGFTVGKQQYGPPELDDAINEEKVKLKQIFPKVGSKILYEYDFGDSWLHEIKLEDVIKDAMELDRPLCTSGQRACPPEDCGGLGGYEGLLEVLSDPKDPEHKEMLQWLGGPFNPDLFNPDAVNSRLKKL